MALKMFDISDVPTDFAIAVFGPTGIGKTTLIGTMPGRGLIVDVPQVEGGTFVLRELSKRIDGVKIENWEEIDELFWALQNQDTSVLPNVKKYKWIAFDSITGFQEMAKRKVINERDRELSEDPHQPSLREYGAIGSLVGELVYRHRKLPYVTIWTAQERTHGGGDNDPGPVRVGPDIIRSALQAFKPSMTILGRLGITRNSKDRRQRTLRVGPPDGYYIVKGRTPKDRRLPDLINRPNLGEIIEYVFRDGPKPLATDDADDMAFL